MDFADLPISAAATAKRLSFQTFKPDGRIHAIDIDDAPAISVTIGDAIDRKKRLGLDRTLER
jgi:hypothetical protein